MFAKLANLFDRNFAIGYFLPIVIFVLATYALMEGFDLPKENLLAPLFDAETFLEATIHAIGLWLLAVLLMALNYQLYQLLEGYDFLWLRDHLNQGPEEIIGSRERHRYRTLIDEKNELNKPYYELKRHKKLKNELEKLRDELEKAYQSRGGFQENSQKALGRALQELEEEIKELQDKVEEEQPRYDKVALRLAEEFPDKLEYVLLTKFGNRIRAFEVYSRKVYGLDLIQGWERLMDVVPNEYRSRIDELKSITDFWVNVGVLSIVSIFLYVGMAIYSIYAIDGYEFNFWTLLFPLATVIVAMLTPKVARTAAGQWGETVKAAVDTFLPELAKRLGFPTEVAQQNNKALWKLFTQSIQGRSEGAVLELERRLEKIKELQEELEKACDEKKYQKAARLREEINKLSRED